MPYNLDTRTNAIRNTLKFLIDGVENQTFQPSMLLTIEQPINDLYNDILEFSDELYELGLTRRRDYINEALADLDAFCARLGIEPQEYEHEEEQEEIPPAYTETDLGLPDYNDIVFDVPDYTP